jgi:lipopolysaccharide/colanic/teichoic acid biosynthesis glycosyltransferase
MLLKRIFDLTVSLLALIFLIPLFLIISILILLDSKGKIFYKQKRVGKEGRLFELCKFRTMHPGADNRGLLTIGEKDSRITKTGYFLRKYKLDELPQLYNVLIGDMSIVGPRPEVKKYTDLYNDEQKIVLSVKPGITDYASIEYSNENEILSGEKNPEQTYINKIMPAKLHLNLRYIKERSFGSDLKIILLTLKKIISQ